jgi:PAS domain S-box-containing protein
MNCQIGVLWPGNVDDREYKLPADVFLIKNVRVDEVWRYSKQLVEKGAKILVGTPSMGPELNRCSPVPVALACASYIDILETLHQAEKQFYPHYRRAALLFHSSNPIQLDRTQAFTRFDVGYYHYDNDHPLEDIFHEISLAKYSLVIGGPTSTALAQQKGYDTFPLRYRSQSLVSGIQKAREILELIQAEQYQLERLRTVLNIIPEGILVTDKHGNLSLCNAQMAEYLGAPPDQLVGQPVTSLLRDGSWRAVYQEGRAQTHLLVKHQGRSYFCTRRPVVENAQPAGAVGIMQEANKIQAMERKYRYIQNMGLSAKYRFSDIVGESAAMREAITRAQRYARFDTTVLIEGETGTGKEVFAQSIHNESSRKSGPFVAVNCAAIAENLLESELMGYEEGAFTGARRGGKVGLFEQAHNGTLFLDEINQMPLSLQPKLLRVIQERVLTRVGGVSAIPINVRIIAAANENLASMIAAGTFRSDLYYRLNILTLRLPPLRERPEDIMPLIRYFLEHYSHNTLSVSVDPEEVYRQVAGYLWPGNVRELQNYLERCSILGTATLNRQFFPGFVASSDRREETCPDGDTLRIPVSSLAQMERELVRQMVERCHGNKSRAALLLDINRNTVNKKLEGPGP